MQSVKLALDHGISGWLSPSGEWFPCAYWEHEDFAIRNFDKNDVALEKEGWARVSRSYLYLDPGSINIPPKRLTKRQLNKLADLGFYLGEPGTYNNYPMYKVED